MRSVRAMVLDSELPVMKHRLSVYIDPRLLAQLDELAKRKNQPKSLVAKAAITSFLSPDEFDRREAALMWRLDRLSRQSDRLHRDLTMAVEALALFIHYWLTLSEPFPRARKRPPGSTLCCLY